MWILNVSMAQKKRTYLNVRSSLPIFTIMEMNITGKYATSFLEDFFAADKVVTLIYSLFSPVILPSIKIHALVMVE